MWISACCTFVDTPADYDRVFDTEIVKYALKLKKEGVIRCIGMSSHDPQQALRAVRSGILDTLMFSINPAFDMLDDDADIDALFSDTTYERDYRGINSTRSTLYRECERLGVGITVMKTYAGGKLFDLAYSPLGFAMTPAQLISYALDKPAVASVLIGCRNAQEVDAAVDSCTACAQEKDYASALSKAKQYHAIESCMYCNHCLPCPAAIDIAAVNKYLDLSSDAPSPTLREHYMGLEHHAGDCLECGACEGRCPFDVKVIARMKKALAVFGK